MKKGIIAITLLLTGALFITPITTNANTTNNDSEQVKVEQVNDNEKTESLIDDKNEITQNDDIQVNVENTYKPETNNNQSVKVETTKEEVVKEETKTEPVIEEAEECGMSKSDAEVVLNNYLNNTQQSDVTYTYQGDENTFAVIQAKGIRGFVFLPNIETDMAYLVDRDNGNIYYFHTSGYFELIK